jgi:glutamate--cysteine ligase
LKQINSELNLKIISLGFDPISKLKEISDNPKKRYEIMTKEMPKKGKLSLDMMYRTCGTQINLDYYSEEDFTKKFKLCSYLVPLSTALFANSPIVEKKNSNYYSYRSKVWQETARGGLPIEFLENMDFEKYAKFIMSFPILFIQKKNNYLDVNSKNFEDFMNGRLDEINNELPDENDLSNHLSTIFTENRLKQYIEIRSIDTCDWDCLCNAPAFYAGLLYGNLDESLEIISRWNKKNLLNAYIDAPKKGLRTELEGKNIGEWSKMFLNLSKKGLEKRNQLNKSKKNETIYLNYLNQILNSNQTNAELMLSKFKEDKDLNYLYEN